MDIIKLTFLIITGLYFIITSSNILIGVSLKLAKKLGISPMIIGVTVTSIFTALPELFINIFSLFLQPQSNGGIGVGTTIGAMLAISTFVMGILLLVYRKKFYEDKVVLIRSLLLVLSLILLYIFCLDKNFTIAESLVLLGLFIVYVVVNVFLIKIKKAYLKKPTKIKLITNLNLKISFQKKDKVVQQNLFYQLAVTVVGIFCYLFNLIDSLDVMLFLGLFLCFVVLAVVKKRLKTDSYYSLILEFLIGAILICLGADILLDNSSKLISIFGIDEELIGIFVIAVGTSLPEFITTVISLKKNLSNFAFGNMIGSIMVNTTLVFGTAGILSSGQLDVNSKYILFILRIVILAICLIMLLPLFIRKILKKNVKTYITIGAILIILYFYALIRMITL